ncbi:MAG: choice-of-anchor D domain-containing protein, partial [Bacteroidales bacterium]|nr:choice-of-anchor D domain-containing protein [Bacteroidales bacterium]
ETVNFNSIDVGSYSAPALTDLDGDGLWDLIIGEQDGNLNHYEQISQYSLNFSLVTGNFNSIDIDTYSIPHITDLEGDGFLDMVVGESYGNLNHYRQQTIYSTSFYYISDNLNSFDAGWDSSPGFADLDDDGMIDLLEGAADGKLYFFEQKAIDTLVLGNIIPGKSDVMPYYLKAEFLHNNLEILCDDSRFGISLSESGGFSQSLSIPPVDGCVFDTVYVRFSPDTLMDYTGRLVHTAILMDTAYITLTGSGVEANSYPGKTLDFDSYNDFVNCGNEVQVTGNNPRSIEAWAYTREFDFGCIFQAGQAGIYLKDFSLQTTNTENTWRMQFGGIVQAVFLPESKNSWHHYCLTYDGTVARLYYDGKLMASLAVNLSTGRNDILFGKWSSYYFNGKIDEACMWDFALDSTEIRERMHLNLTGSEPGLVGYWQFNEGSGNKAYNILGKSTGALTNMDNSDWVISTIPFGGGVSATETETPGLVDFTGTGLLMDFNSQTGASITATRIDTVPNINPTGPFYPFNSQYWVVNRYGTGSYDADMTFTLSEDLTPEDQVNPSDLGLWTRGSTADTNWAFVCSANAVNAVTNQVTFNNVTMTGQFTVTKTNIPIISVAPSSMDFGDVIAGSSKTMILEITNIGLNTLIISDIVAGNTSYSANPTNCTILPGNTQTIEVELEASNAGNVDSELTIYSNAPYQQEVVIALTGAGVEPDNFPGNALYYDGINDYVDIPDDIQVTGSNPRTIEAWAFTNSFNNGGIFQAGQTGSNGMDFSLRTTNADNEWKMNFWGNDLTVILPHSKNNWHHYCMTYDGSTARLYYDGALVASKAVALNTGSHDLWLGRWEDSYFAGKIDEVRMWDYALDSLQIRENMNLNFTGTVNGLSGYWQFNEENGNEARNFTGGPMGSLINMDDSGWVASTIPFGGGASDSQIESNGTVDFSGTGLSVYYNLQNAAPVTAARIDTIPNILPEDADAVFSMQYWAVHRYGSGTFNADVKFSLNEDILPGEEANPQHFRLYSRSSTSDEDWILLSTADSVNSGDDFLIFEGIEGFSQFIIGKKSSPEISISHAVLNFGNVVPGDSAILAFYIHNTGNDTLFVYDIVADHPDFSVNPSTAAILPAGFVTVEVKLKPQDYLSYQNELTVFSNDPNESELVIVLKGVGKNASCIAFQLPFSLDLISYNFNAVDVGSNPVPAIVDLDNDGLLDLIIGTLNGNLYHYRQVEPLS